MKKIPFFFILLFPFFVNAQFFEIGASVGSSNYLGELSSNSSRIDFKETNLAAGGFIRYNVNHLFAIRAHARYTTLSGTDAQSKNETIRDRNLSFRTDLYEMGLMGEINLLGFDPVAGTISPYLFGGYSYYRFNPQAELDGQYYNLRPLGTEGQRLQEYPERDLYSTKQWAIPFGLGMKMALSENMHMAIEIGGRKLFTDYLDDVSLTYPNLQFFDRDGARNVAIELSDRSLSPGEKTGFGRGDTKATDWYFISSITFSYNFLESGLIGGRKGRRRSKIGCPTF